MDTYTRLMRENPVVLVAHNGTLLKAEDNTLRSQIKKLGGKLVVTRSNLFNAVLRGLDHPDPASRDANKKYRFKAHPLGKLFKGPTAVIAIPELDPKKVEAIVKVLDKTNERLILLGGQVDGSALDRSGIDHFKSLPPIEQLRADLAGVLTVLGGAGLVQTLESSPKMLYLTLDAHRKNVSGESDE
ncbi:mitochondrial 54S ribosomal protein YmL11 [Sugiyamaella lignohabitans]|uniref:Mitochondrial 54S ribosomal protein YmL11 n=1 Tax=Sugiyamaella lignohabitans TaxID=796027 RepID=A0A167EHU7_9ASCO|nr:mitochondrial 54S ribosomal protein YmL11 [Sugiyamaella lignohabitans]ANB14102.1 mitochondrial 54S ribosomal protein YmL11 [Sugiyamaella lignohabitans]